MWKRKTAETQALDANATNKNQCKHTINHVSLEIILEDFGLANFDSILQIIKPTRQQITT